MKYKIYKIVNDLNDKVYIGYTTRNLDKRYGQHLKHVANNTNRKLYDAMRKYGVEHFGIRLVDENDDTTLSEWLNLETLYIVMYDSVENGYNMTYGGIGGPTCLGKSMKGKTCYDAWMRDFGIEEAQRRKKEMYEKVAKANRETPPHTKWTDEQRKSQSETLKRVGHKPPRRVVFGNDHQFFGKHHTADAKRKIADSKRGKSYEEIMGKEVAKRVISQLKVAWSGKNNPNFIDIPSDMLYQLLVIEKRKVEDVAKHFGVRHGTIIDKCKKLFGKKPGELKRETQT